jgi:hypothetical protein
VGGVSEQEPLAAAVRPSDPTTRPTLRLAVLLALGLAVLGALLGLVWAAWSGPQQRAYVVAPGKLYPFDEVETSVGADGRYLTIVAAVGLLTGLLTWYLRPRERGPVLVLGMCAGGLGGAALTWWIGYLSGGGSYRGKPNTIIKHLPLSLHMHGLLLVEPALIALVYGLLVSFTAHDDLGRPDPVRESLTAPLA